MSTHLRSSIFLISIEFQGLLQVVYVLLSGAFAWQISSRYRLLTHRGSYMSVQVSFNLFNESGKRDKMRGLMRIVSLLSNEFNKSNNTEARMLDYNYHIVGWESKTCIFDFYIFQERQKWISFASSVLHCWKSDRIIFSNIQIHCYWCFELPINISRLLWKVYLSYIILTIFSWKTILIRHFDYLFHGKTSRIMYTKVMVCFIDMIFWSMIDAFLRGF